MQMQWPCLQPGLRRRSNSLPPVPPPPPMPEQGPDASTELQMIELLRGSAAPAALPLLPHLLRARRQGPGGATAAVASHEPPQLAPLAAAGSPTYSCTDDEAEPPSPAAAAAAADGLAESPLTCAERIARQFGLNQEQAEVLAYVASWQMAAPGPPGSTGRAAAAAAAAADRPPPICLVHGPFGSGACRGHGMVCCRLPIPGCVSCLPPAARPCCTCLTVHPHSLPHRTGKSSLLVAILHFLLEQRRVAGSPLGGARVAVCAHTNVAVDRVMLGALRWACCGRLRQCFRVAPQRLKATIPPPSFFNRPAGFGVHRLFAGGGAAPPGPPPAAAVAARQRVARHGHRRGRAAGDAQGGGVARREGGHPGRAGGGRAGCACVRRCRKRCL